jgi:glycosyltransferase involved in cell wall biosynthesis
MLDSLKQLIGLTSRPKTVILGGNSKNRGSVAISYLTWPFREGWNSPKARGHTNAYEVLEMASAFQEQGFRVEICDWDNTEYTPPSDCRIAIDIHGNLERWDKILPRGCLRVLHATGPHWLSYNKGELDRMADIRDRKGVALIPRRQVTPSNGIEVADYVTVLGNQYTIDTFSFAGKPITRIPISSAYELPWPEGRDIAKAKRKYLWVGSFGMVQKGLDLVIEAFSQMPDLELTVCGRPEKESDFFKLYEPLLKETRNIHLHGWLDMGTDDFLKIAKTHAAIVYPGSGEGGAGSVIHCMHAGMVPIVTPETSIDCHDFGLEIQSGNVCSVVEAVRRFSEMDDREIQLMASKSYEHVRRIHTRGQFSKNYRAFAQDITQIEH